ncbi:dihydrolipoamide S-succinyltransferase [Tieghemostelium lacteum]|uniref:dihydrolipoyllysine-residue succinyltransferase n=1 Tax=Tieghemostelium lacteum TaxID=361077 RepID=A0A151ZFT3_TIELA|nr:dihydrolipoamide S-succinyltransferase [Tieghemostelium lacteum]|eukprot:KYQ92787.1 dihydrolipoamide S-succinyltransferase [Tieghemostelium lacteum]
MLKSTKILKQVYNKVNQIHIENCIKSSVRYYSISNSKSITQQPKQQQQQYLKTQNSSVSISKLFNQYESNRYQLSIRSYSTGKEVVVNVPTMGDSISEGTIVSWNKKIGDSVKIDDVICSIETDKVTIEINATMNGKLVEHFANEGDTVSVGAKLYKIEEGAVGAEAPKAQPTPAEKPKEQPKVEQPKPQPQPQPQQQPQQQTPKQEQPKTTTTTPAPTGTGERRIKMTRIRARTAQRLKDSQNTAAMLTTFNEVDMSALMNLRTKYKDEFVEKHGVKLGFMSAFVKASAIALQEQPILNASVEEQDIVYHDNINISVAVASPKGLVVPVVRNCQGLSFAGVEKEIGRLSGLARKDQLAIEDSMGGTFTISNGGVYGSMFGTPIINPPQSAILGMHAVKDRVVVIDGKMEIRPIMYVALTYDHRIIDGREAVTFLKKIKDTIENPERIVLDL